MLDLVEKETSVEERERVGCGEGGDEFSKV